MLMQLIIIQVLTFLAIVFVLRWMLYAESAREVQRLKKLREENLQEQKELQQRMKESEAVYQRKLAEAEEAARTLRSNAKEEAEALKASMLDKAREEADRIVKTALNTKEKIREEIIRQMRKGSPALASRIFKGVLSEPVKRLMHQELVNEAVKKIKEAEEALFSAKVNKGELIFAYPLSKADKGSLTLAISRKLGYEITLEEKEDRSIVCGAVIRLGTLVIDASLNNRLRQVEDELGHSQSNA